VRHVSYAARLLGAGNGTDAAKKLQHDPDPNDYQFRAIKAYVTSGAVRRAVSSSPIGNIRFISFPSNTISSEKNHESFGPLAQTLIIRSLSKSGAGRSILLLAHEQHRPRFCTLLGCAQLASVVTACGAFRGIEFTA
jgi:hypothetical protein